MTQQVLYATSNGAIMQWQDTSVFSYPAPQTGTATIPVTPTQWETQGTAQYVSAGALVAGTAPVVAPALTLAQQAFVLINSGIAITSTGSTSLNGTYATNAAAQSNLLAIQVYLQANGKFPGSSGSLLWLDANNNPHTFTSTGQFTEFASAIADYVADLTLISMTGSGTLPPSTTTIA